MRISDCSSDVCSADLVDPAYETATVQRSIEGLLRERRGIGSGEEDNFRVTDTQQIADTLSGTKRILTTVLGAVAAVSLLVGRSAERSGGKRCVSTCRSWWWPDTDKQKKTNIRMKT